MHYFVLTIAVSMHAPNDDPQLRGVLIQSRVVADESMVGSFAVNADSMTTTRLSSCTRADVSHEVMQTSLH